MASIACEVQEPNDREPVVVGVDTHKDTHHAAVLTLHGERVADCEFAASSGGYGQLMAWAARFGQAPVPTARV